MIIPFTARFWTYDMPEIRVVSWVSEGVGRWAMVDIVRSEGCMKIVNGFN